MCFSRPRSTWPSSWSSRTLWRSCWWPAVTRAWWIRAGTRRCTSPAGEDHCPVSPCWLKSTHITCAASCLSPTTPVSIFPPLPLHTAPVHTHASRAIASISLLIMFFSLNYRTHLSPHSLHLWLPVVGGEPCATGCRYKCQGLYLCSCSLKSLLVFFLNTLLLTSFLSPREKDIQAVCHLIRSGV